MDRDDARLCTTCGHVGLPTSATPGSIWIEVVLWLCFIIPGIVYSIWRLSARHDVCVACGARTVIPVDTAVAQRLITQLGIEAAVPPRRRPSASAYDLGRDLGGMFRRR